MHQTIRSFYAFANAFQDANRGDQFSTDALRVLFDYLEQYEEDTGQSIELDVVALCCDFTEMSWRDVASDYRVDVGPDMTEDECIDAVRDYLSDHTAVCGEYEGDNGPVFVFQVF